MVTNTVYINPETGKKWDTNGTKLRAGRYWQIHVPNHPNAKQNGCVLERRLIMEGIVGRYLLPDEEVHHIDKNGFNNNPLNLKLLTGKQHRELHHEEWNRKMWKTANKKKNPNMARVKKKTKTIIITTRRGE